MLGTAPGTVKAHVQSILSKLSAKDRTHAVTIALRRVIIRLHSPKTWLRRFRTEEYGSPLQTSIKSRMSSRN
jgi:hypothetical protein